MNKIKKKTYISYLVAFFIPVLISVLVCIGNKVYPFGEECILHVDMYHQYCPFFIEFMDRLQSGKSLMYSWNLGMGSDFVSLYAYYLASPLNFLMILWPKDYVIEFMTVLIILKMGFSGWSFFYFLKGNDALEQQEWKMTSTQILRGLAFSTAYALSGFMVAYNWDIMWLDVVMLAPLVILGLKRLVCLQKPGMYFVTLALSIWSNYYMAIMLCMVLVLYFVLLLVEKKGRILPSLLRFGWYSLLAGGASAVLLLPELKILSYSGSSGIDFPETVEWYFHFLSEVGRSCATAEAKLFDGSLPNLYAGSFTLFLLVLYALNRNISWKEKLPRLGMVVFFLLSFANNWLDFLWHGFHFPDSLPGRQSFLYIFLLLVLGYTTLKAWRGTMLWHILAAMLAWGGLLFTAMQLEDQAAAEPRAYILTGAFIVAYGILYALVLLFDGKIGALLRETLFTLALCELAANLALTGFLTTSRTAYLEKMQDYHQLLALADDLSGEQFYRVEDTGRKTKNDGALYGYPSVTQFSSLMDVNVSHFFQGVYMEGGKNYYCYNGAIPLTSALFSVKYFLSDNPTAGTPYRVKVGQSNSQFLYENTYCLPPAYLIPSELADNWVNSYDAPIASLNDLGYSLGEEEDLITEVEVRQSMRPGMTQLSLPDAGYYFAAYDYCNADSLTVTMGGLHSQNYSKTTHRYLIELGYAEDANTVSITNSESEQINFHVYKINEEVMENIYNALNRQAMQIEEWSDTRIRGQVEVKDEEAPLLFSIPAEDGWSLYVDGEEEEFECFQDAFLMITLEQGEHEIELRYRTPLLIEGGIISLACLMLFGISIVLDQRVRGRRKG